MIVQVDDRNPRSVFEQRHRIQTAPGKGWLTILRLRRARAWFDKTWRPSEIELVN